jgi:hypothetical protein
MMLSMSETLDVTRVKIVRCIACGQDKPHNGRGMCGACSRAARRAERTVTSHGYNGYGDGCRCDDCKAAKRDYMTARRSAAYLAGHEVPARATHGTRSTYEEHGCRCNSCVVAQIARGRAGKRREKRQRNQFVQVRFTDEEHAVLAAAAQQSGKGKGTLLRESFFRYWLTAAALMAEMNES